MVKQLKSFSVVMVKQLKSFSVIMVKYCNYYSSMSYSPKFQSFFISELNVQINHTYFLSVLKGIMLKYVLMIWKLCVIPICDLTPQSHKVATKLFACASVL